MAGIYLLHISAKIVRTIYCGLQSAKGLDIVFCPGNRFLTMNFVAQIVDKPIHDPVLFHQGNDGRLSSGLTASSPEPS